LFEHGTISAADLAMFIVVSRLAVS
jgi:hypothetical protein